MFFFNFSRRGHCWSVVPHVLLTFLQELTVHRDLSICDPHLILLNVAGSHIHQCPNARHIMLKRYIVVFPFWNTQTKKTLQKREKMPHEMMAPVNCFTAAAPQKNTSNWLITQLSISHRGSRLRH